MRTILFLSAMVALAATGRTTLAQSTPHSIVRDSCTLQSKILDGERRYAIYLPPGYETSQRSYPVLYLLHGGGDDQTGWVQFGEVQHIADKSIAEGTATPMIIAMPDANTGRRGYFNDIRGGWDYEDFFFNEFIPHIEATYRAKADKRYRAVAGLSMGGGGAFMYAMHRPDMFSSSCPLSASTGALNLEDAKRRYNRPPQDENEEPLAVLSDEQIEKYLERHSALKLAENLPVDELKSVRWYIDCGDDDFLYEGNSLIHIAMRKREIPHEFRIRDGGHRWSYWRSALPTVLGFVSEAFHQN